MIGLLTREEMFAEIYSRCATGEETRDELRQILMDNDFFTEVDAARAVKEHYDRIVNRMAQTVRRERLPGADGKPILLYSIKRPDKATGKTVDMYVQLWLMGFEDLIELVKTMRKRRVYWTNEETFLINHGCATYGETFRDQCDA